VTVFQPSRGGKRVGINPQKSARREIYAWDSPEVLVAARKIGASPAALAAKANAILDSMDSPIVLQQFRNWIEVQNRNRASPGQPPMNSVEIESAWSACLSASLQTAVRDLG
jgi:hypothetical protein